MSIAGIVLGVVGSIVTVIVLIAVLVAAGNTADKIGNDIGGSADASDYDVQPGTCEVDQYGIAEFKGTIKNTAGEEKNFTINVEFRNPTTNALIESSSDLVSDLAPGDTAEWSTSVSANDATRVNCNVTDVENFFN
jgi:predicted small secreted protein